MKVTVLGGFGTAGAPVAAAARAAGHDVEAASRRTGADVLRGEGLDVAFSGTEVVIDAFNHFAMSAAKAVRAHQAAAENILAAAGRQGVAHVVLLSIVGVDRNPKNYYAGKAAQEKVYEASDVPHTIQRVTQFHEFAPQLLERTGAGPLALAPTGRVQPVGAHEAAQRLLRVAEDQPQGRRRDYAGPQEESLSQMVKAYARATGRRGPVIPARMPVPMFRGLRRGLNLPSAEADRGMQTFGQWLEEQL